MRDRLLQSIYTDKVEKQVLLPKRFIVEYSTKRSVVDAITKDNPDLKAGSGRMGSIRVQPKHKVEDSEQFKHGFLATLNNIDLIITDTIKPGDHDSPSGKFLSYRVQDLDNNEFVITLGGGAFANAGMNYERELMDALSVYFNDPEEEEKPLFLEKLEEFLDVKFVDLDQTATFTRRVKRPLSDEGPEDKGDEIADITLIDEDDKKYYISLKNIGGKTVSNAGAGGMFEIDKNKAKFVNKEKGSIGKKLMAACDVDVKKVEKGLTDYINQVQSPSKLAEPQDVTNTADFDKIEKFLGSAFDYGYIYVKQRNKKDDLEIADLSDEDKLYDFIGKIETVKIKYPYYESERHSRKYVAIVIVTEHGNYSFQLRNASGGILPNQINLVKLGSVKDMKVGKASVKALGKSKSKFEDMLTKYD